jgi:hypothetical protein
MSRSSVASLVAPQAASTLKDEVHWSYVRNQEIEVDIEALLQHLCADDYTPLRTPSPFALGAEPTLEVPLPLCAILREQTRVQE